MSQKSAIEKQPIIAKAAIHEGDTGSPEVQVALLTARINDLQPHFKELGGGVWLSRQSEVPLFELECAGGR